MKKLLLVGAFLLGMSTISFAQGRQQRSPDEQVTQLKTQVTGITDDQATKIKAIYVAVAASRDSLMKAGGGAPPAGGDRTAMMQTYMKSMAATDAKIKAVLTADQAAAYQKIADARAEQMKQFMNR